METKSKLLFTAISMEGSSIKKLFEVLKNIFKPICLSITESGIYIRSISSNFAMLFDIELPRDKFKKYFLVEPLFIELNVMNLYRLISEVKRKDALCFEIYESNDTRNGPDKLFVKLIPKENDDFLEVDFVAIRSVQCVEIDDLPDPIITHPIHIPYQKFDKVCKSLSKIGKDIRIKANNSYVHFSSDVEEMYGKGISFGEVNANMLDIDDIYDADNFSKISKISGFGDIIYFYSKKDQPIVLQVCISSVATSITIGSMKIYIKSKRDTPKNEFL